MVSPASAANIQALLAAFPGLLSANNPAGLLAMTQGLSFVNPLLGLSPSVVPALATKLPANVLSPPAGTTPSPSGGRNDSIIDFSTPRRKEEAEAEKSAESTPRAAKSGDSPLDLSAGRTPAPPSKRERDHGSSDKGGRREGASHHAAAWAASLLKSQGDWNNGHTPKDTKSLAAATSDASRALERMTELSRLSDRSSGAASAASAPSGGRQSAWQSHWLSKGADTAKDVLKCVWCKQSFDSLAALTTHMKESKHCGVNASLIHAGSGGSPASQPPSAGQSSSPSSVSSPAPSRNNHSNHRERDAESSFLKETVQLPRKLVRGQDVWLGKGAEQTRQILKCMWCGQSFRSLAEMTTHMQQTQHYTNIISQEQIISWKAADGETKPGAGSAGSAQNHVNAVLTCKVCDQAFSSLKELSSHMVKNSHYKEHIMRSISESGGRRRQARDKRKKALPVRKLLELERAQQEARGRPSSSEVGSSSERAPSGAGSGPLPRIPCEKCGEKIDTSIIVEHIRVCVGSHRSTPKSSQRSTPSPARPVKSAGSDSAVNGSRKTPNPADGAAAKDKGGRSPSSGAASSSGASGEAPAEGSSPSVLNAIEKLIEKSFDPTSGKRGSNAAGSNILRRLGIDESMDYTKPLMDPMTVNMLRLYGSYQRERSTSEASSASERVNGSESAHRERDSGKSTPKSRQDDAEATSEGSVKVKTEQADEESDAAEAAADSRSASPVVRVKNERPEAASPCPSSVSERSLRSATPASSTLERKPPSSPDESGHRSQSQTPETRPHASLSALSSMFEGLSGSSAGGTSSNPLAALQKLCDKTETSGANGNRPSSLGGASSGSGAGSANAGSSASGPGAILAFSWACNDAIMTDSIMKCAFCDTQFISKGAYRHHLSKMHFVKDGPPATGGASGASGSTASSAKGAKGSSAGPSPQPPAGSSASSGGFSDESPHSKFLKYTELAKQLSSKYV